VARGASNAMIASSNSRRRPAGAARPVIAGDLVLDDRVHHLFSCATSLIEVRHQVKDARLVGALAVAHPVVGDVAIIERVLPVGELARDGVRRMSCAAASWIVSPRLRIDLPFLRCAVIRSQTSSPLAASSAGSCPRPRPATAGLLASSRLFAASANSAEIRTERHRRASNRAGRSPCRDAI